MGCQGRLMKLGKQIRQIFLASLVAFFSFLTSIIDFCSISILFLSRIMPINLVFNVIIFHMGNAGLAQMQKKDPKKWTVSHGY